MLLEQSQAFWQRDTGIERTQLAQAGNSILCGLTVLVNLAQWIDNTTETTRSM